MALGTVQWGSKYGIANRTGQPRLAEVQDILSKAKAAGITMLDTARAYGASEEVIGQLVGADAAWQVFTKLAPVLESPQDALDSLQASRAALRRGTLDGVLLHRAHHRTHAGGVIWDVLRRERDAGRIGRLGVSAVHPDEAWAALDDEDIGCIQVASSILDQRLHRADFFQRCRQRGVVVFVRSIFLQGVAHLPIAKLPPHLRELTQALEIIHAWAAARSVASGLAFLSFAARLPGAWVLLGCETPIQLEENLAGWNKALRLAAEIDALAAAIPPLSEQTLNPALWPQT